MKPLRETDDTLRRRADAQCTPTSFSLYSRLVSWKEHAKADRVKRGSGSEEEVHKRECS